MWTSKGRSAIVSLPIVGHHLTPASAATGAFFLASFVTTVHYGGTIVAGARPVRQVRLKGHGRTS